MSWESLTKTHGAVDSSQNCDISDACANLMDGESPPDTVICDVGNDGNETQRGDEDVCCNCGLETGTRGFENIVNVSSALSGPEGVSKKFPVGTVVGILAFVVFSFIVVLLILRKHKAPGTDPPADHHSSANATECQEVDMKLVEKMSDAAFTRKDTMGGSIQEIKNGVKLDQFLLDSMANTEVAAKSETAYSDMTKYQTKKNDMRNMTDAGLTMARLPQSNGEFYNIRVEAHMKTVKESIGSGSFGLVKEAVYSPRPGTAIPVAIKFLKVPEHWDSLRKELELLESLPAHPNIVKCYGGNLGQEVTSGAFIVEELMHMNLSEFVHDSEFPSGFKYSFLVGLFGEMAAGLAHLHRNNVVHYDLKPQNIMLDKEYHAKLADFGRGRNNAHAGTAARVKGTVMFMPPECILSAFFDKSQASLIEPKRIDIYSLGVVMWECVARQKRTPIPDGIDLQKESRACSASNSPVNEPLLRSRSTQFPIGDHCPEEIRELIWACVSYGPGDRPTVEELKKKLVELKSCNWVDDPIRQG